MDHKTAQKLFSSQETMSLLELKIESQSQSSQEQNVQSSTFNGQSHHSLAKLSQNYRDSNDFDLVSYILSNNRNYESSLAKSRSPQENLDILFSSRYRNIFPVHSYHYKLNKHWKMFETITRNAVQNQLKQFNRQSLNFHENSELICNQLPKSKQIQGDYRQNIKSAPLAVYTNTNKY